jgi:hypothetical protein
MDKHCWKVVQQNLVHEVLYSWGLSIDNPHVATYQLGVATLPTFPGSLLFCFEEEQQIRAYCRTLFTYTLLYGLATDVQPLPEMASYTGCIQQFWTGNSECYQTERTPWGTVGCTSFTPERVFHLLNTPNETGGDKHDLSGNDGDGKGLCRIHREPRSCYPKALR